ncbi:MAG: succinate dehydrogenase, cytochrome b556 subunit [Proteobacteria bacterium]|nr:succinate dehydrogenase, cytochrome b556 subunit [Pseudomonadota bacterium]
MTAENRPLSPHIFIYRLHLTTLLSGLHRITGVMLIPGSVLLVLWLWAAATGTEAYATATWAIGSWLGRLCLFGWTFSLFYHLCNGIRHLFWDAGHGFELARARASGLAVVAASGALTLAVWIAGYAARGG